MQNLTDLRRRLEAGKLKSRDLVETCLERIADTGGEPLPGTPAEFGTLLKAETAKWGAVVRASVQADKK